ncbi:hypothetical protein BASA61_007808 [Batrachochytrium salamandrivorans]|nr:hypothetical protein BASA61_007808 [Batrachochytrium salamandrivorans]
MPRSVTDDSDKDGGGRSRGRIHHRDSVGNSSRSSRSGRDGHAESRKHRSGTKSRSTSSSRSRSRSRSKSRSRSRSRSSHSTSPSRESSRKRQRVSDTRSKKSSRDKDHSHDSDSRRERRSRQSSLQNSSSSVSHSKDKKRDRDTTGSSRRDKDVKESKRHGRSPSTERSSMKSKDRSHYSDRSSRDKDRHSERRSDKDRDLYREKDSDKSCLSSRDKERGRTKSKHQSRDADRKKDTSRDNSVRVSRSRSRSSSTSKDDETELTKTSNGDTLVLSEKVGVSAVSADSVDLVTTPEVLIHKTNTLSTPSVEKEATAESQSKVASMSLDDATPTIMSVVEPLAIADDAESKTVIAVSNRDQAESCALPLHTLSSSVGVTTGTTLSTPGSVTVNTLIVDGSLSDPSASSTAGQHDISLEDSAVSILSLMESGASNQGESVLGVVDEEEEKMRHRRERIEQWKKDRAAKNPESHEISDAKQADVKMADVDMSTTATTAAPEVKKSWNLEDDDDDDMDVEPTSITQESAVAALSSDFVLPKMTYSNRRNIGKSIPAKPIFTKPLLSKPIIIFGKSAAKSVTLVKSALGFRNSAVAPKTMEVSLTRVTLDDEEDDDEQTDGFHSGASFRAESQVSSTARGSSILLSNVLESDTNFQIETAAVPDASLSADEADPLDEFMADVQNQVTRINKQDAVVAAAASSEASKNAAAAESNTAGVTATANTTADDVIVEDDDEDQTIDANEIIAAAVAKLTAKKKDIVPVNHSQIDYEPFRKDFYIEPPELASMTAEEVDQKRIDLDGIKIRGVRCPKPIEKWTHFGMPPGVLEVIRRVLKYERPSSIQSQAIPAIVGGRDVIGIAKTGSGKTIAFLLPMFRHIKDQRPIQAMEGPIALIMTPTRELAVQIHRECKHFTKVLNLRAVCCYGGSPIKDQIAELKRGAEIIICTPGRMIDLLCSNAGRVTNLRRVTYLVLDEADRMFDMGFEPQVMKMVNNIRPDRQTVLFSATFPRKMEALARKILRKPLEITVGGRSVVASDVTQIVEVHQSDEIKFLRLLEILGLNAATDADSKILIFVDRQEAADNMLNKLLRRGYPCQSLHGGKDQADRDSTLSDFKTGSTNILIATSVAARGLDVKQLKIVVNYECPNHMEDYVHRVGRTGRAGNKGTAYTFIMPEQDRFALDIVKALTMSGVEIPAPLQLLTDRFMEKIKSGYAHFSSSGFGGRGLEQLDKERDMVKRIQKKSHVGGEYECEDDEEQAVLDDEEEEVDTLRNPNGGVGTTEMPFVSNGAATVPAVGTGVSAGSALGGSTVNGGVLSTSTPSLVNPSGPGASTLSVGNAGGSVGSGSGSGSTSLSAAARAQDVLARINASIRGKGLEAPKSTDAPFFCEVEINDYVQKARWRVTNKEQITLISEVSGTAITTRGTFVEKGKQPGPGQRKLYLFIEGESQMALDRAKVEIKRILTEATLASMEGDSGTRYSAPQSIQPQLEPTVLQMHSSGLNSSNNNKAANNSSGLSGSRSSKANSAAATKAVVAAAVAAAKSATSAGQADPSSGANGGSIAPITSSAGGTIANGGSISSSNGRAASGNSRKGNTMMGNSLTNNSISNSDISNANETTTMQLQLPKHDETLDLDLELESIPTMTASSISASINVAAAAAAAAAAATSNATMGAVASANTPKGSSGKGHSSKKAKAISNNNNNTVNNNPIIHNNNNTAANLLNFNTDLDAVTADSQMFAGRSKKQMQQLQQQLQLQQQQMQQQMQQQTAVDNIQQQMRLAYAQAAAGGKQQIPGNRPPLMFDYALAAAAAAAYNPLAAAVAAAAAARSMNNQSQQHQSTNEQQQQQQNLQHGRQMMIGQNELQAAQLLHQTMTGSNALDCLLQQSDPSNSKHPIGSEEWMRQRRENHREVERKRRETISDGIAELAKMVPDGDKNKGSVLQRAIQYILQLQQQQSSVNEQWSKDKIMTEQLLADITKQNEILKDDNQALRKRIADDAQQSTKRLRH